MVNIHEAAKDIFWIGGSDRRLALFENLFPLPDGVTYNSYIVKDEKTVLFDTADVSVADQYFENLEAALEGKAPDYLVILHMEPDHCALISQVVKLYPNVTLVGGAKTFTLLGQFFPGLDGANKLVVKEGDTLSSGSHTFHFVAAPMVHWPEVLMAYDDATGALFSADYTVPVLTAPLFEPLTQGYGHDALPAAAAALENDGTRPFTIIGARVNGNRANCFTVTAAKDVTVAPGERDDSSFLVSPTHGLAAGEYTARLVLILSDGRTLEVPFSLTVVKG